MRPDRRDFVEPGDLIVTTRDAFILEQLVHNDTRWSWDGYSAPPIREPVVAIVVGTLPAHLAWDMAGDLKGWHPNSNVGIPRYAVSPENVGWHIHQSMVVDTKHPGARTVEDERSETLENNE